MRTAHASRPAPCGGSAPRGGKNLDVEPTDRVAHAGRDLDVVGEIKRWPSPEFESGVDHVELTLEYKNG